MQALAAVESRLGDLVVCARGPTRARSIPTTLRVNRAGVVTEVRFDGDVRLAATDAECLRSKMLAWRFDELKIRRELQLLVELTTGHD